MSPENPKPQQAYGYYNFGVLQGIASTRRGAIREVEENCDEAWSECRRYMEVHKVIVTPIAKAGRAEGEES